MAARDEQEFQKWYEDKWIPTLKPELHNSAKALINDDSARQELMNGYLRQSDYTQKAQAVADERRAMQVEIDKANQKVAAYDNWYQSEAPKVEAASKEIQRLAALENALKSTGFNPQAPVNSQTPNPDQANLLREVAALRDHIQKVDRGTFEASVTLPDLAFKAAKEGYSFDSRKIVEISTRTGVPLQAAFEEFTKDEREARNKASFEKQLEEARESGRRDALSKVTPDSHAGVASNPVLDRLFSSKQQVDNSGQAASVPTKSNYELINRAVQAFVSAEGQDSPF